MKNKQIIRSIKKSLASFDFTNLDERCSNEAQTRFNLIEPLLEILGYSRIDDFDEYNQVIAELPTDTPVAIRFYRQGRAIFRTIEITE